MKLLKTLLLGISPRSYLIGAGVLLLSGSLLYIKHTIYQQGYTACKVEVAKLKVKQEKKYEKIQGEVSKLSDSKLDARLSEWVRD